MTKPLWAPWRLEYIKHAHEDDGCVFCREAADELSEDTSLLVRRGEAAFAILNKFPYSSGHLMVAPIRHEGSLAGLTDQEALELHRLSVEAVGALDRAYGPDGFNLGWNIGHVAGAGITDHVHLHVVPRWSGDTNFMPVLADVKVLPEHLLATRDRLREAWTESSNAMSRG
jgi:ATP adenylyltransferase